MPVALAVTLAVSCLPVAGMSQSREMWNCWIERTQHLSNKKGDLIERPNTHTRTDRRTHTETHSHSPDDCVVLS